MEIIERVEDWRKRYHDWRKGRGADSSREELGSDYPFVENKRAPFVPARRALPMLNLALISSAGAYIDGTEPFDTSRISGDTSFCEIPIEVEAEDLLYTARGYDPTAVRQDRNALIPIERLFEFTSNGIIGQLNPVFWSFCGFIPDASRLVEELVPKLVERVKRYEVQAALLVPASRLCHQSVSLVARALEQERIPTMMLSVEREVVEMARPPRAAYYEGELGSVAGRPHWPEYQRRILDEALRLIEPIDQPGVRKLVVDLETQVEKDRGER
ncbi:MAG TPA: glycine/sarcosine/betaine reductase selenoprotein B family protein [Pyrinomonadaceae bacterium]